MKFGKWSVKVFKRIQCVEISFLAKNRSCQCKFFFFLCEGWPSESRKELDRSGTEIVAKFLFFGCFSFYIFSYIWVFPNFIQLTPVCNHKKGKKCCKQAIFLNRQICTFFSYLCFYVIKPDNLL